MGLSVSGAGFLMKARKQIGGFGADLVYLDSGVRG